MLKPKNADLALRFLMIIVATLIILFIGIQIGANTARADVSELDDYTDRTGVTELAMTGVSPAWGFVIALVILALGVIFVSIAIFKAQDRFEQKRYHSDTDENVEN